MLKPIYNITPFTLLDYPDKTACILWFAGCNMRCVYCYNPEIVFGKGKITLAEVLKFLTSRKSLLDGVVLSGGECTSHKCIKKLLQEIKNLNYLVKIDTNGSNFSKIEELIDNKLVDYIALDFKASPAKYKQVTGVNLFEEFETTLKYLLKIDFPFEVRTTVHSQFISIKELQAMCKRLENYGYRGKYYLQYFLNGSNTIGNIADSEYKYLNLDEIETTLQLVTRN